MPATQKFLRDYYFKCLGLPRTSTTITMASVTVINNEPHIEAKLQNLHLIKILFTPVIYSQRYDTEMRIPHICGIYIRVLRWLFDATIQPHYVLLFRGLKYSGVGFTRDELNSCLYLREY